MPSCKHHEICGLTDEADPAASVCVLHSTDLRKNIQVFTAALNAHRASKGDNFKNIVFPEWDFRDRSQLNIFFGSDALFAGATFTQHVNFAGAIFDGFADFSKTRFAKGGNFMDVTFRKGANFKEVTFDDWAFFGFTKFKEEADFSDARFNSRATFSYMEFAGLADFREAKFIGETYFDGAHFKGLSVKFRYSSFQGRTLFSSERLGTSPVLIFSGVEVDFREVIIQPPDAISFREADLTRCRFLDTDLRKVELTGVVWPKVNSRICVYDEIAPPEPDEPHSWNRIERLYRELKQNYEDRRDYERAGDFHYGEKEMRRSNPATSFGLRLWLTLYRYLGGYGERYFPPLIWSFALFVAATIGYMNFGIRLKPEQGGGFLTYTSVWDWLLTLNYSLRVMLLLRPDDLFPVGCARFINTFQSMFGPVFLALFGLALRQRLRR